MQILQISDFSSRCSNVWIGGAAKILKRCLFPFYRFYKSVASVSSCIRLDVCVLCQTGGKGLCVQHVSVTPL